jgi:hypothetical protein
MFCKDSPVSSPVGQSSGSHTAAVGSVGCTSSGPR